MKPLLLICFVLFAYFLPAQNPGGTYIATSLQGEIDSLVIKSDHTFDFRFYYPGNQFLDSASISEGIYGTWKIKNGTLYLHDKSGNRMNFKLQMVLSNGTVSEVVIIKSGKLAEFKNLKLIRQ